ncbi:MAG TPA: alpha/beta hydrolase [Chloroflexia bacterium]|nr:alpha/beta hydrolase [Chloroflexia bacterium]
MPLHPTFQAMVEAAANTPPSHTMTIEEVRLANIALIPNLGAPEPVARTEDCEISGPAGPIPVRIYTPDGTGPFPILICLHGGGMVAGNKDVFDNVSRALTNRAGCISISVDYRLAPENKFPVPLEDCYAVLQWATNHGAAVGGDPARVAVLGESAGANLTAGLALLCRDRGGPKMLCQVLVNPLLDYTDRETVSMREFGEGYGLSKKDIKYCVELYTSTDADRVNSYALPMKATNLSNLPPALVLTSEYDPLRDEGEIYADKLREAGVPTIARRYDGVLHGFFIMTTLTEPSNQAIEETSATLRTVFETRK